ncbi:MAG: pilus (MSHA type) biogenesis protein MshL [Azoarcus sp.]|jgi:MSHA biogenesis protein MshL|nr:pilus (MSHA type) biogenesis protein MshL [Azoarcus sp.]
MKHRETDSRGALRILAAGIALSLMTACSPLMTREETYDRMKNSLNAQKPVLKSDAQAVDASLPPLARIPTKKPPSPPQAPEPRFDLSVRDATAGQVFMAIVNDSRYSMVLPPDLSGTITVNLKNVTVQEALELIRDIYGYNFRINGTRILVSTNTPQTRIFQVSYLAARRGGTSSTQVISSSMPTSGSSGGSASSNSSGSGSSSNGTNAVINTSVFTGQASDFWLDLGVGIASILDCEYKIDNPSNSAGGGSTVDMSTQRFSLTRCPDSRRLVMNQQSGVIMVRALPVELREISDLLKALQGGVERQVMLEAKLIEVELNDGFQSGINWTAFDKWGRQVGGVNASTDTMTHLSDLRSGPGSWPPDGTASQRTMTGAGGVLNTMKSASGLLMSAQGALRIGSFSMIIDFLKTQGSVYVMSSPRIATLNNQKAVLKVGVDDYFVTEITNDSNTTNYGSGTTNNMPSIKVSPFFSGIALDVTPQIGDSGMITLHIRPAVTDVATRELKVNLGEQVGEYTLPLASSKVKETDSIVRVRDGYIVAIGGLMSQAQSDEEDRVPGLGDIPILGKLFKNTRRALKKREMVVLIKPTVITDENDWQSDLDATQERLQEFDPRAYPSGFLNGPSRGAKKEKQ